MIYYGNYSSLTTQSMHPILQNKYVRFGLYAIGTLLAIFVFLIFIASISSSARHSTGLSAEYVMQAPTFSDSLSYDERDSFSGTDGMLMNEMESSYYEPPIVPIPSPSGYTEDLETYETTQYSITGKSKEFDAFCDVLENLKGSDAIHFKSITRQTNYCRASFYVEEVEAAGVLATLTGFKNIEYVRDTESVTRHKQRLESQTSIIEQQLVRTEKTLAAAEAQLERLNAQFASSNEVARLSSEVTNSLRYIDQLTQRKINYLSQLNNLYQQSADLASRMDVVEFSVNVSRANPIIVGKYEREWDSAWEDLKDTLAQTLIGLTALLGIFLLRALQFILYALIVLIVIRGLWKFVKLLWQKW